MKPASRPRYHEGFQAGQQQLRPTARAVAGRIAVRAAAASTASLEKLPSPLLADARADRLPADAQAVARWERLGVRDLSFHEGRDGCAVRAQLPPESRALRATQLRALAALTQEFADGCARLLPGGGIELRPVPWREVPVLLTEKFAAAGLELCGSRGRASAPAPPALRELPQGQSRLIVRVPGARCLSQQFETLATLAGGAVPHGDDSEDSGVAAVHFVVDRHDAGKALVVLAGIWDQQADAARAALADAGFAAL